jgi:hypothetical protein
MAESLKKMFGRVMRRVYGNQVAGVLHGGAPGREGPT